jgi:transposase
MGFIAIGGDVSKGRLDVAIRNESGTQLHAGVYDDTAAGHAALRRELTTLYERYPGAVFIAGVESTGALEANWLAFFRTERRWLKGMRVHRLSPAQVQRHLSADLHRSVTDAHAADGIARYLLERLRDRQEEEREPSAAVQFYRMLRSVMHRRMEVEQQLHAVLIRLHPDLVQYCRSGFPQWILTLLERFPTAADLAKAPVQEVDAIRYIMPERAATLVRAAQTSVASLTGPAAQVTTRLLLRQWRDLEQTITDGQQTITTLIAGDAVHREQVRLLTTIPGIGEWTAQVLSLELGDLARFRDDRALVAWCGLDPHEDRSGDGIITRGISHRGNAQVRRALFMPAFTAAKRLPAVAALDQRLRAAGKPPLVVAVACMHKLLRIAYAVVRSAKPFDPEHELHRRTKAAQEQAQRSVAPNQPSQPSQPSQQPISNDLTAPVSAHEAKRRKNAAARVRPGCEVEPQKGLHAGGRRRTS